MFQYLYVLVDDAIQSTASMKDATSITSLDCVAVSKVHYAVLYCTVLYCNLLHCTSSNVV